MRHESAERRARLAAIASSQHGRIARRQLLECGFSPSAIQRLVAAGYVHPAYRGVYAVGHPGETEEARDMAAVLACGPDAVLSHWRAAVRWELLRTLHSLIDISVPTRCRGHKGIRIHEVKLDKRDVTKRDNIPITTVPRTLIDLAAVAKPRQLARATNEAVRRGWLTERVIAEMCERYRGRNGMAAFKAVVAVIPHGTRQTRSDLEVAFLRLCRRYSIERPLRNKKVEGFTVDFYWPHARAIVELDSYDYHRTPQEFDSDRRKWAFLQRKGYNVLPIGDAWLNSDPGGVAEHVRELLGRRALRA